MPRKTRKGNKKIQVFDFSSLNEIVKAGRCKEWQELPECLGGDFFSGKDRVFAKYRTIFPDKYKEYIEMGFGHLKRLVHMFPRQQCEQIVFGTGEDIILYIAINNKYVSSGLKAPFTLYMPAVWSAEANLIFTQCAIMHRVNTCLDSFFIRILLPKNYNRLLDKDGNPRITLLELYTIYKFVKENGLKSYIYRTSVDYDYDIVFI